MNPNEDHPETRWQCEACSKYFPNETESHSDESGNDFCEECYQHMLDDPDCNVDDQDDE